ncbi:MAG: 3-deoxy-D-manno-octulosonic acid transferase [Hydrogenophilaceae bacterium]|nr:3-deoxy-D-manno-octulosonic acid transferase [Hydrogenophilaceae bacterium]
MRRFYSLAWLLALPLAFFYLLWRSRHQPEYRRHWLERLGFIATPSDKPVIWVHAVSVGETRAAEPLIRALQARHPDHAILLTHMTPTGRAPGRALFGDSVAQGYLPYDLPWLVRRFLHRAQPRLGLIMETEVWPSLFAACREHGVPLFLVNARLSEKSAQGYARLRPLVQPTLACLAGIAAQTEADAERLRQLANLPTPALPINGEGANPSPIYGGGWEGEPPIVVVGNLKFDVTPPTETAARAAELRLLFGDRFAVLVASSREGEEAWLLDALMPLDLPGLLLVIVPRHPQRFDEVARLIADRGLNCPRRSRGQAATGADRVYLGDSMGEMAAYCAASDIVIVGGSLLPFGGQNLIEASAAGKPVLLGPHTWNFEQASEDAVQSGAARRVQDVTELAPVLRELYGNAGLRERMGVAGAAFAQRHRGATERILRLIEPALGWNSPSLPPP